ncbi:hypothetical protein ACH5RR_007108 [Cinchona calisaya]|uniref:Uncharacterized protein n=1 Tax=Cinchona calisaya TaxID=153742 RepID=A0ABD3AQU7_9GENT
MANVISTLVPITTARKREVHKTLIQGALSGNFEKQLNCAIVGSFNIESSTKGLSNMAKGKAVMIGTTRPDPTLEKRGVQQSYNGGLENRSHVAIKFQEQAEPGMLKTWAARDR